MRSQLANNETTATPPRSQLTSNCGQISRAKPDVQRVLWAPQISPHVQVSGHVYDVETGLVTTVVDAKAPRQPA
jgi:carbonic anhydrase